MTFPRPMRLWLAVTLSLCACVTSRALPRPDALVPDPAVEAEAATAYLGRDRGEPAARMQSEYALAVAIEKRHLPGSASVLYAAIVRQGPTHLFRLKAVEALVRLQPELSDDFLIPQELDRQYEEAWGALPPQALARINLLMAIKGLRVGKLD